MPIMNLDASVYPPPQLYGKGPQTVIMRIRIFFLYIFFNFFLWVAFPLLELNGHRNFFFFKVFFILVIFATSLPWYPFSRFSRK